MERNSFDRSCADLDVPRCAATSSAASVGKSTFSGSGISFDRISSSVGTKVAPFGNADTGSWKPTGNVESKAIVNLISWVQSIEFRWGELPSCTCRDNPLG